MSKLRTLHFDDPKQAEIALARLRETQKSERIGLYDALAISWPESEHSPQAHRPLYLTIPGKGVETLQSLVINALSLLVTLGSAARFVAGHLLKGGITTNLVNEIKDRIVVGTSILVLITDEKADAIVDSVLADLSPIEVEANSPTGTSRQVSE